MNRNPLNLLLILLALADCTSTTPRREAENMSADTSTEAGEADLPATDRNQAGWCCDCNSKVGKALDCTPATADSCIGPTLAWCKLDADGTTSACEAKCDKIGWCCDCSGQPHVECWHTVDDACTYQWCHKGPSVCADKCPPVVCCDCTTKKCWPSDGLDCDAPHLRWCVLEPDADCFATCG